MHEYSSRTDLQGLLASSVSLAQHQVEIACIQVYLWHNTNKEVHYLRTATRQNLLPVAWLKKQVLRHVLRSGQVCRSSFTSRVIGEEGTQVFGSCRLSRKQCCKRE